MSNLRVAVTEEDHAQGPASAPCTVVEYGDYQCPHCRAAHPVVEKLRHNFGNKLRFVFRNFPLNQSHPEAQSAAETAEFAGSKGKFWEMHDALFQHQDQLGELFYVEQSKALGLDGKELKTALADGTFTKRVQDDFSGGVRSGVNGTPTFFINGERHNGSNDFDRLSAKIGAILQAAS
jgi:protein-disulfide isomerase